MAWECLVPDPGPGTRPDRFRQKGFQQVRNEWGDSSSVRERTGQQSHEVEFVPGRVSVVPCVLSLPFLEPGTLLYVQESVFPL